MLLRNVSIVGEAGTEAKDILLEDDRIKTISPYGSVGVITGRTIEFNNAIVFPGLINSHDHLDFDLFPQLGNRIYPCYREWGNDIHSKNKEQINAVLQIPQPVRTRWGMYRNLLNGFTTVVNHGDVLTVANDIITVHQKAVSLHSVGFEKNWKWKLNRPHLHDQPVVIHAGEGTDKISSREIDSLIRWNIFKRKLVAIHGVAMDPKQAGSFKALVWCPVSNFFLLNHTARINELKHHTNILFGSDSTLTAGWNIWEHLRIAQQTNMLSDKELFDTLTTKAAAVWALAHKGSIQETNTADLVVVKRKEQLNSMDAFYAAEPADILLVIHRGEVQLFDDSLYDQSAGIAQNGFSTICINNSIKYVKGDLDVIVGEIKKYDPEMELPLTVL